MDMQDEKQLLTAADVGRLLSVHPRTVWRLSASGDIPRPIKVGDSTRWVRQQIDEYIADKAAEAERERERLRRGA